MLRKTLTQQGLLCFRKGLLDRARELILGLVNLAEGHCLKAQLHFCKSLEIFGEYIVVWDIARSLSCLGDALLLSGSLTESRSSYIEALHVAREAKTIPLMLEALAGLAEWELTIGRMENAFELSGLVLEHPVATREAKNRAQEIYREAEKLLVTGKPASF